MVYQAGDWVFLKIQPYKFKSLAKKPNEKISPSFCGVYQIAERIEQVLYRLFLPKHSHIHPVFHVSSLELAMNSAYLSQPLPPMLSVDRFGKVYKRRNR